MASTRRSGAVIRKPSAINSSKDRPRPLILIVDGDATNRAFKSRSLQTSEMEVLEAEDGTTALALAAGRQPSLVLLERNTPELAFCQRLRTEWPDAVIIQITAAEKAGEWQGGADCTLTTPVEPLELVAVTRAMLRHAEAQAREASEDDHMIFESAVDHAIITWALDGHITSWNFGAEAILGHTPQDIIGEPCTRIFMADDVLAGVHAAEMRSAHGGISVRTERWHLHRDGTRLWCSGRMLASRDRRGEVVGYLKILYDRTMEKIARDALEALELEFEDRVAERTRALTEANERLRAEIDQRGRTGNQIRQLHKMEALGQLTGGIAHDFNNLLTAILGGLEVTRRRVDDARTVRLIDSSISAAQRGAKLIAQLQAFASKQNLHPEHLSLNTLVRDMHDLLQSSVGAAVGLDHNLADDVWPVLADANQVQTTLLNLVINARDAMPDGGTLRIGSGNTSVGIADADLAAGDYATLTVQDNGSGMTPDVQARIFEPFFTTKEVGKGTGLGLAQVYGFVCQSGGSVRMHSEPGQGTTFTILLPRAVSEGPTQ
jgi:PAS domain S-box-containing protein